MSIFQKLRRIWQTEEAQEFREDVVEKASDLADKTASVANKAYEKTSEVAGTVAEKAKDVVDDLRGDKISYDTFKKVEVRVGTINSVEKIEKSDKLLRLMVNVGEAEDRQIISGIATYFKDSQKLVGRQAMFVTNLEPRTIFGYESNGMIFAVNDENNFSILEPDAKITDGTMAS